MVESCTPLVYTIIPKARDDMPIWFAMERCIPIDIILLETASYSISIGQEQCSKPFFLIIFELALVVWPYFGVVFFEIFKIGLITSKL